MTKTAIQLIKSYGLLAGLLLLVFLLRVPNFFEPYWYTDEGFYLAIGQALNRGDKLYQDIFDHKTPMLYWLAAVASTLHQFKAILFLSSIVSTILFYFLSLKLTASKLTTAILGVCFVLATSLPRFEGNIVNGELILMPFVLLAVLLFWSSFPHSITSPKKLTTYFNNLRWYLPILIGLSFSIAVLTKVPSIFELVTLGIFLILFTPYFWHSQNRRLSLIFLARLGLGFFLGLLIPALYFLSQNIFTDFINLGFLYNFRYIDDWSNPFAHPAALIGSSLPGRLIILATFLLLTKKFLSPKHLPLTYTLIWFVFSLFAATLSLRPYPHYFLQLIPPLLLTLGLLTSAYKKELTYTLSIISISALLIHQLQVEPYPVRSYYYNFHRFLTNRQSLDAYINSYDPKTIHTYNLAQWLSDRTTPDQTIYIHGDHPMLYALSQRPPATKYIAHFHVRSLAAYPEVISNLESSPPKYIVDYIQDRSSFPQLYSLLDIEYTQIHSLDHANIYLHSNSQLY